MLIIGLTGSIGMGKSTAAARFRAKGIAVSDADALVHELYRGSAVRAIEAAFPGTTTAGKVDRRKLSAALLAEAGGFQKLEQIVHPMVRAAQKEFLRAEFERGSAIAVLEIPLLFEGKANHLVDVTIVVSAPAEVQTQRVLERPGMTEEKFAGLLARQMPDAEKRRLADFIVDTSGTIEQSGQQIDRILVQLHDRTGLAYARNWA